MNNLLEKIKNLNNEKLEFYQNLINFFDLIGISTEDLNNLVKLVKSYPDLIKTLNSIIDDQSKINEHFEKEIDVQDKEQKNMDILKELNREREVLNPYGK